MARNRILVVEDDEAISRVIIKNLISTGYAATPIYDGKEAAELLERDADFDLALLDIMLPGIDGFALMGYMKHHDIPAIYLTAKSDIDSKIQGLRDGAEDYIVKPFEILELLVRIEKVLERTGKMQQVLDVADLTINLMERSVRKNGKEILLKPISDSSGESWGWKTTSRRFPKWAIAWRISHEAMAKGIHCVGHYGHGSA